MTNGDEFTATAQRTDSLIYAAMDQLKALPPFPTVIMGDPNASTHKLHSIAHLLNDGWIDVGHHAQVWNRTPDRATCVAPNSKNPPTRRDYVITNPAMTSMIQDFNVTWDDDYAVHAELQLMIKPAGANIATKRNHKP